MNNAPGIVYDRADADFAQALSRDLARRGIVADLISSASLPHQVENYQWFIFVRTSAAVQSPTLDAEVKSVLKRFDAGHIQGVLAVAKGASESEDIWSSIRTYNVGTSEQDWQRALDKIVKTLSYSGALNGASTPQTAGSTGSSMGARTFFTRWKVLIILFCVIALVFPFYYFVFYKPFITKPGKPTPTVHASPTINLTATHATDIQQYQTLYTNSITRGKLVLTLESLAADKTSLWDTSAQCILQGKNSYIAKASATNALQLCMATKTGFGNNFAYQAKLSINPGGYAGGLVFRSNRDIKMPYYRFAFIQGGTNLVLANGPSSPPDIPAQLSKPTILTAIVSKNIIYLYINGTYVHQVTDTLGATFDQVGIYAASQGGAKTDVTFTDVKAWTLA